MKKRGEKKLGEVKVIKKEIERVSTGILELDKITKGGFIDGSTNLIVGGTGSGKSILALQFLIDGMKRGENCLYVAFEERKEDFYNNALSLGWNLFNWEKKGKFHFLQYTPEKVRTMLEEGGGIVETIVLTKNIKRIVIDSVTSFELLFEEDTKKRAAVLMLFNMLSKWNLTSLLTYERDPVIDKKITSRALEFESDSIIYLYLLRIKNRRERFLEVLKMRGTNHSNNVYPLRLSKGGFKISLKPFSGKFSYRLL